MNRWTNKVAVVSGASAGIGAAIVKDLIKNNIQVIGLARRSEKVEEIRSQLPESQRNLLHPMKCDISKEDDVEKSFAAIEKQFGGVDILINNAGVLKNGNLVDMETSLIKDTIDTNIMGVIYCTREAYKSMKKRNVAGHVVIINSTLGHKIANAPISFNIYAPTKFAITAIREIYKNEFQKLGTNIKTTSISPGLVETNAVPDSIINLKTPILQPEDIANAVVFALSTPPHVQISELTVEPLGGF